MKLKIVFFGSSKFVIPIIEVLQKNFTLSLVLTTERLTSQREALEAPVINYCTKHKIPYLSVSNLSDPTLNSQLSILNSEVAVLASFGAIIPNEVLNLFPHGIINIHPSLLPKYRGPTPVQTAILNGDKTTGVTIIKLDEQLDHGPILSQTKENILPNDTSESLYERLFQLGAGSTVSTIELYLKGKIKPQEQDHKHATFTPHLARLDGYVYSNKLPSRAKLEKMIKAYFPWPGVWTRLRPGSDGQAKIIKFLPGKKLQVEGKKPVCYKDFVNGYPTGKDIVEKLDLLSV